MLSAVLIVIPLCYDNVTVRHLESCPPFYRIIKHEELWLYQNPVHPHDTVPTAIMLVSLTLLILLEGD